MVPLAESEAFKTLRPRVQCPYGFPAAGEFEFRQAWAHAAA
jgi:hypothetical protein